MSRDETRRTKPRRPFRIRRVRTALYICCAVFFAGAFVWGAVLYGQGTQVPESMQHSAVRQADAGDSPSQPDGRSSAAKASPSPDPAQSDADVLTECTLIVPSLGLELPVSAVCSDEALLHSVCKFSGPQSGQKGNYVIAGHDFVSGAQFARLPQMNIGDRVVLRDKQNKEYTYTVYSMELVTPEDVASLAVPASATEATLLTCAQQNTKRLLVRCRLE